LPVQLRPPDQYEAAADAAPFAERAVFPVVRRNLDTGDDAEIMEAGPLGPLDPGHVVLKNLARTLQLLDLGAAGR
jgi:hypothetical protein